MPPLTKRKPGAGGTGSRKFDHLGGRIGSSITTEPARWRVSAKTDRADPPQSETAFSAGLRRWASRRAERLADDFLRHHAGRVHPSDFFEQAVAGEHALAALKTTAHAAYWGRLLEHEASR